MSAEGESDPTKKVSGVDLSNGPVTNRKIRDPLWIVLYIVHIVVFLVVAFQSVSGGDVRRLTNGMDFMGNVCGAKGAPSLYKNANLQDYPYVMYTFNVTMLQLEVAKGAFGDPTTGAASTLSTLDVSDVSASAADPAAMAGMVPGGGATSMVADMPKYFQKVCVKSCELTTTGAGARKAYWKGFLEWGDHDKYNAGTLYTTAKQADATAGTSTAATFSNQGMWGVMAAAASLPAAAEADCPYPSMFCSPANTELPTLGKLFEVKAYGGAYCLPTAKSAEAAAGAVADAAGAAAGSVGAATEGASAALSDIQKVWWTFIVVAFISVVVAMVYLVILRFTIGIIVWGSLALIMLMLLIGFFFLFYTSQQCAVDGETDIAKVFNRFDDNEADCPSGYKVTNETQQMAMLYGSYVVLGIMIFYMCFVFCMRNKIRLAIALNQVAASFVTQQPYSLLVPPCQLLVVFVYFAMWIYFTLYIVSFISGGAESAVWYTDIDGNPATGDYTYTDAEGISGGWFEDGVAGKCVGNGQYLWAEWGSDGVGDVKSIGNAYDTRQSIYRCKGTATEDLGTNYRFWFALLNILWVNEFTIAFTQCSLAGAVAAWYFAKNDAKLNPKFVLIGLKNTTIYHSGSVALGSLIVALIQLVKYYLQYLAEQQKKVKNKIMEMVFRCLAYLIWCVEKCVKFLNKNAYIQIAILGKKFCWAAKDAFWLIFRNAMRIAICAMIAPFVKRFGVLFVMVFTTFVGYQLLNVVFDDLSSPVGPCLVFLLIGNMVGRLVMGVFGMAVDTALQCFVMDEELNGTVGEHTPPQLKQFLADNKDAVTKDAGKVAPSES